jgi:hypothetical protein
MRFGLNYAIVMPGLCEKKNPENSLKITFVKSKIVKIYLIFRILILSFSALDGLGYLLGNERRVKALSQR